MANAITIPAMAINGNYIPLVPNSLEFVRGKGTTEVHAQSIGAAVEPVFQKNLMEAYGHVTFEIYPTEEAIELINLFQDAGSTLRVDFTDPTTDTTYNMSQATICNDPNLQLGADKTISVEIKGKTIN